MHITSSMLAQTAAHAGYWSAQRSETIRITKRQPERHAGPEAFKTAPPQGGRLAADPKEELRFRLLVRLFESLTGKRIKIVRNLGLKEPGTGEIPVASRNAEVRLPVTDVEYTVNEKVYEAEKMTFSANGLVKTADGREVRISVDLRMSREFYSETNLRFVNGTEVKDPLVVNYAGTAASLGDGKISFDLDSDGRTEEVAKLAPGSGYLALDENGDGEINGGTELFGPATGDGFRELEAYDSDGNGWIDGADPVYGKLKVWILDQEGERGSLIALAGLGIGAISLQNLATPFELNSLSTNETYGRVASTSVFLREDGSAGTVQRIDLAV